MCWNSTWPSTAKRSVRPRIAVAALAATALACAAPAAWAAEPSPAPTAPAVPVPAGSPQPVQDPCASLATLVSRPTFSTSACAVKPGDLMLETGYTNVTTSGAGANSAVTYPQASLRVGAGRNLEFDLDPSSYERISGSPAVAGAGDSEIGFKYEIGYTSKLLYGANVLYTLANGDAQTSSNGAGVLANLNASLTLSPALGLFASLGYNAQSAGPASAPQRFHGVDPSLGASLSLPASFSFALEGYGQSSTAPGLGGRYGFDAALERDIGSRVQLDVNFFDDPGAPNGSHVRSLGFGAAYLIGS